MIKRKFAIKGNKILLVALSIFIVGILIFSGCTKKDKALNENKNSEELGASEAKSESKAKEDTEDKAEEDSKAEDESINVLVSDEEKLSKENFSVPVITIASDEVDEINREIHKHVKELIDLREEGFDISLEYNYEIYDSKLSLMLRSANNSIEAEINSVKTYIIDLKKKEIMSKDDILNYLSLNEEQLKDYLYDDVFAYYYYQGINGDFPDEEDYEYSHEDRCEDIISYFESELAEGELPIFIDESGRVSIFLLTYIREMRNMHWARQYYIMERDDLRALINDPEDSLFAIIENPDSVSKNAALSVVSTDEKDSINFNELLLLIMKNQTSVTILTEEYDYESGTFKEHEIIYENDKLMRGDSILIECEMPETRYSNVRVVISSSEDSYEYKPAYNGKFGSVKLVYYGKEATYD